MGRFQSGTDKHAWTPLLLAYEHDIARRMPRQVLNFTNGAIGDLRDDNSWKVPPSPQPTRQELDPTIRNQTGVRQCLWIGMWHPSASKLTKPGDISNYVQGLVTDIDRADYKEPLPDDSDASDDDEMKKGQTCVNTVKNKHRIIEFTPAALRVVVEIKDPGPPRTNTVQFTPCVLVQPVFAKVSDGLCRIRRIEGGSSGVFFFKEFRNDYDTKSAQRSARWNELVKAAVRDYMGIKVPAGGPSSTPTSSLPAAEIQTNMSAYLNALLSKVAATSSLLPEDDHGIRDAIRMININEDEPARIMPLIPFLDPATSASMLTERELQAASVALQCMDSRLKDLALSIGPAAFFKYLRIMFSSMRRRRVNLQLSQLPGFTLRFIEQLRAIGTRQPTEAVDALIDELFGLVQQLFPQAASAVSIKQSRSSRSDFIAFVRSTIDLLRGHEDRCQAVRHLHLSLLDGSVSQLNTIELTKKIATAPKYDTDSIKTGLSQLNNDLFAKMGATLEKTVGSKMAEDRRDMEALLSELEKDMQTKADDLAKKSRGI